jgi:hypothetical protein
VPEHILDLSAEAFGQAIQFAAQSTGRPAYLFEKDFWVVWTLAALFDSPEGKHMTFKGGTSLSKVYRAIDRFSEDVDVTYDIRQLIPDITQGNELPPNASQQKKWTEAVRARLPGLLTGTIQPLLEAAIARDGLIGRLKVEGSPDQADSLLIMYPKTFAGPDYISPWIRLEFGARATGEPNDWHRVTCDMVDPIQDFAFPEAQVQAMRIERTFWEKATAAHVFCGKQSFRGDGERFSRHWFDLACLYQSRHFDTCRDARAVAQSVADHKALFFREKDVNNQVIDYGLAVSGQLDLVPTEPALEQLKDDYEQMVASNMFLADPPSFDQLITACAEMAEELNAAAPPRPTPSLGQ